MSISQPLPDRGVLSGSCPTPRFPRHLPTSRCPPRPHMTHGSGHRGLGPLAQQKGQARRKRDCAKRDLPLSSDPGEKRPRATGPCRFESGGVACTSPLDLATAIRTGHRARGLRARSTRTSHGPKNWVLVIYRPEIAHPVLVAKGRSHHAPRAPRSRPLPAPSEPIWTRRPARGGAVSLARGRPSSQRHVRDGDCKPLLQALERGAGGCGWGGGGGGGGARTQGGVRMSCQGQGFLYAVGEAPSWPRSALRPHCPPTDLTPAPSTVPRSSSLGGTGPSLFPGGDIQRRLSLDLARHPLHRGGLAAKVGEEPN